MKLTIINFTRHNPWGTSDYATHYYVDGKRISKHTYQNSFNSFTLDRNWKYDNTKCRTVVKDGITRDYTEIFYKEK